MSFTKAYQATYYTQKEDLASIHFETINKKEATSKAQSLKSSMAQLAMIPQSGVKVKVEVWRGW